MGADFRVDQCPPLEAIGCLRLRRSLAARMDPTRQIANRCRASSVLAASRKDGIDPTQKMEAFVLLSRGVEWMKRTSRADGPVAPLREGQMETVKIDASTIVDFRRAARKATI